MDERWLPVVGWERAYEVSSLGRLRRVAGGCGTRAGRILNPTRLANKYLAVRFRHNSRYSRPLAHRVVAEAFLGPPPAGMQVNHKDGVRSNNHLENLEYVSCSGNHLHAYRTLGRTPVSNKGTAAGRAKLTDEQVRAIRIRYAAGDVSQQALADEYSVSQTMIGFIVRRANWSHL